MSDCKKRPVAISRVIAAVGSRCPGTTVLLTALLIALLLQPRSAGDDEPILYKDAAGHMMLRIASRAQTDPQMRVHTPLTESDTCTLHGAHWYNANVPILSRQTKRSRGRWIKLDIK